MTQTELQQYFLEYAHDLHRFLTSCVVCTETAADIVQETFLRFMQSDLKQEIDNPRALLFRVAKNLAIDCLRRDKRQAVQLSDAVLATLPDLRPSAETVVFTKQQVAVLKRAIAELPPKCREVFILHKFRHLSYAEIAAQLGIARSTVVKHMIKALEHCKNRVDAVSH